MDNLKPFRISDSLLALAIYWRKHNHGTLPWSWANAFRAAQIDEIAEPPQNEQPLDEQLLEMVESLSAQRLDAVPEQLLQMASERGATDRLTVGLQGLCVDASVRQQA